MGEMHAKVTGAKISSVMAIVMICINACVLPGAGTMITGVLAGDEHLWPCIIIGFLQMITFEILIGWIWAVYTAIKVYQNC